MEAKELPATFEGWAHVELMGHQSVTGYARTVYFGANAFLHVKQPAVAPFETIAHGYYEAKNGRTRPGQKVLASREEAERYVSAASIYAFTPMPEAAAMRRIPMEFEVIEEAPKQLAAGETTIEAEREEEPDYADDEITAALDDEDGRF